MKIYVAAVEALKKKEKDKMKLSLPPKLLEKLVWVPNISRFVKFSFSVTRLMPYYAKLIFHAPMMWETLGVTLFPVHLDSDFNLITFSC